MHRPLKVLFVEDRDDDAELLAAELRRSGFDLDWCRCDTYPALDAALTTPPDLVLCDYGLPGMDPVEVLCRLRTLLPGVPVVVVSGVVDADVAPILFQHGAADLLHKDRLARLGPAVREVLAKHEAAALAARAAKQERETAADLLSGLVNHAPAAICISHLDGTQLVTNRHYEELLHYIPPQQIGELTRLVEEAVASESAAQCEVRFGSSTFLALSYPVTDSNGEHVATGMILTDITEQKDTEVELRLVRAALQAQALELQTRNAELMELNRLKTDLVSTVSHELRTPLTSIVGYSELLGDSELGSSGSPEGRMLEMISRNSQRLLNQINNLLLLAQLDGGGDSPADQALSTPVIIADVIEAVGLVILPSAHSAGLDLVTQLPPQSPVVPGDRDQLERVLLNLTANAVKFSQRGGTVTLRLIPAEDHVLIEVVDQGIGMSEQDLARLGTRFFRSDTARIRHLPGTGLGVSVVQSIVIRHGGTVRFTSRPGEGTTAQVRLPLGPVAAEVTPSGECLPPLRQSPDCLPGPG